MSTVSKSNKLRRSASNNQVPEPSRVAKWPPNGVTVAQWCVGVVVRTDDERIVVSSGFGQLTARRALSCLLQPNPGDTVACICTAPDEAWITTVLDQDAPQPRLLPLGADVQVTAQSLQFSVDEYKINSKKTGLHADQIEISCEKADLVGKQLTLVGSTVKLVGSVLSSVFDRVNQFSKHYSRRTDGMDRVSATHIESHADQLARLEAENLLINGSNLVKARGGQIHFG